MAPQKSLFGRSCRAGFEIENNCYCNCYKCIWLNGTTIIDTRPQITSIFVNIPRSQDFSNEKDSAIECGNACFDCRTQQLCPCNAATATLRVASRVGRGMDSQLSLKFTNWVHDVEAAQHYGTMFG